ncbi:hypothetical protein H0H92_010959 [Tricholoma furcatifolium]|nr:hypothetical protein H0H92_010959 [Tricholoma furcatifolium]
MLGIEDYGSGSDNDSDQETVLPLKPQPPKPSASSSISLPPPKTKRPKKITIGLPSLPSDKKVEADDLEDERPAAKRPRLENGAGTSALLSMLPAPKKKAPEALPPVRVLGGGKGRGLDFGAPRAQTGLILPAGEEEDAETSTSPKLQTFEPPTVNAAASLPFLPPSLKKGRVNISVEEDKPQVKPQTTQKPAAPTVDFFSLGVILRLAIHIIVSEMHLGTASSSKKPSSLTPAPKQGQSSSNLNSSSIPAISSAPTIPTFEIPEPSQTDEYPGYYQLPSGTWAAHDPAYYATFVKKWQDEYDAHVRALEKGMAKGFEDLESSAVEEVDAMAEMERAKREIQEREERKAVTQGAAGGPSAPKMTMTASKMSGIARSRHQLSTLLREAYENRDALEEKIAMGKRNRKEAGNKYVALCH